MPESENLIFNFNTYTNPAGVKTRLENDPLYSVETNPIWVNQTEESVIDLLLNLAIPHDRNQDHAEDLVGNALRGFFTPPTTANYTFFASCNDDCALWINDTNTLEDAQPP